MGKVYGRRWERIDSNELGHGGQGRVFRVRDVTGTYTEEAALKLVPDFNRHDRFRNEIEAIKRLTDPTRHGANPNIVSLIDHSALNSIDDKDRQYLVMPIAKGGDLGRPGQVALYKDLLDGVLAVARQLAQALHSAHAANIIHRDVKPANILFTGNGHEVWLTDFGICLVRDAPRLTEKPEVMGPRNFMAPELEQGGRLDVGPSADIYSLGKVIYFMLSGGTIIPRERIHEDLYRHIFDKGERYRLMEILLRQMICSNDERIQGADEVIVRLDKIARWEQNAHTLPVSEASLSAISKLQQRSMETGRIAAENKNARAREQEILNSVQISVTAWLKAELEKTAAQIASHTIKVSVQDAPVPDSIQIGERTFYDSLNGVEVILQDIHDQRGRLHVLQFFLCRQRKFIISVTVGDSNPQPKEQPPRDAELAILPVYLAESSNSRPRNAPPGYISRKAMIGTTRGCVTNQQVRMRNRPPQVSYARINDIMPLFESDVSLHAPFRASEWPGNEGSIRTMLKDAIEAWIGRATG